MAGPDTKTSDLLEATNPTGGFIEIILPDGSGGFISYRISISNSIGNSMSKTTYDPRNIASDIFDSLNIDYDNVVSGLVADDVQNAIDELADALDNINAGEANAGVNLGGGTQIYVGKSGVDLQFNTISQGNGIAVNLVGNEIVITNSVISATSYIYTLIVDIDDSKPGPGNVKFNNADHSLVTFIYIDNEDADSIEIGPRIANMLIGDKIILEDISDKSKSYIYKASGSAVQETGYVKIPVIVDNLLGSITIGTELKVSVDWSGGGGLSEPVEKIDFNPQDPILPFQRARIQFDDLGESFSYYVDGINGQELKINEQSVVRIKNVSGSIITRGQVLAVSGVEGTTALMILGIANNLIIARATLCVAIADIPIDGLSFGLRFGGGVTLDTSLFAIQDLLYLSPTIPGGVTNIEPLPPNYPVVVGIVGSIGVNGDVGIRVNGFQGNDTSTNIQGTLNGIVTKTPNISFIVIGGIIYADVINESFPLEDLPFMIGGNIYLLNTTTGAGVGGAARIIVPPGASPILEQKSWIYITLNLGIPELGVSTVKPAVQNAMICTVVVFDAATTLSNGKPQGYRRENNAVDSKAEGIDGSFGFTRVLADDARSRGSAWDSGQDPTPTVGDLNILLALSSGVGKQLHYAALPLFDGLLYQIYNDETNTITYEAETNLVNIVLDANGGTLLGNGFFYTFRFYYKLNSNGVGNDVVVTRPQGHYLTGEGAESDALKHTTLLADTDIEDIVYPIYDMVVVRTGTGGGLGLTVNLHSLTSLRSKTPGVGGGSSGEGITTDDKVRITAADSINDYLSPKVAEGDNITITILNPGTNEQLSFAVNPDFLDTALRIYNGSFGFKFNATGLTVDRLLGVPDISGLLAVYGMIDEFQFGGQVRGGGEILVFDQNPDFDFADGNTQEITLTNDLISWTISNELPAGTYTIYFIQDGTGNWAIPQPTGIDKITDNSIIDFVIEANDINIVNIFVTPSGVSIWSLVETIIT